MQNESKTTEDITKGTANNNTNPNLIELYKEMNIYIRDFSDREWETIKFFTYIFIALLTAYISFVSFLISNSHIDKLGILLVLPSFMYLFSFIGLLNFRRECARLFERTATIAKIEEKLGLREKRTEGCKVFKDDEYYLPLPFIKIADKLKSDKKTTENFVEEMLKFKSLSHRKYRTSFFWFALVFILFMVISVVTPIFISFVYPSVIFNNFIGLIIIISIAFLTSIVIYHFGLIKSKIKKQLNKI